MKFSNKRQKLLLTEWMDTFRMEKGFLRQELEGRWERKLNWAEFDHGRIH